MQAVKRAVREEPGTSQKRMCVRELTTAITNSNHPDPNQLTLAMPTTRQLEAVAQRWIENGVFHFRYNAAMFHTICVALIK